MQIKNTSERRIGFSVDGTPNTDGTPTRRQVWLEIGVNDVADADWKSGKADVACYVDSGELTEVAVKAPAKVEMKPAETKPEPKAEPKK